MSDEVDDTHIRGPDPDQLAVVRLGIERHVVRSRLLVWGSWALIGLCACAGSYVAGTARGDPQREKHEQLAVQLTTCQRALQVSVGNERQLSERLVLETAILDDCRASCGTMRKTSPP